MKSSANRDSWFTRNIDDSKRKRCLFPAEAREGLVDCLPLVQSPYSRPYDRGVTLQSSIKLGQGRWAPLIDCRRDVRQPADYSLGSSRLSAADCRSWVEAWRRGFVELDTPLVESSVHRQSVFFARAREGSRIERIDCESSNNAVIASYVSGRLHNGIFQR